VRAKTRLDSLPRKEAAFIEPMECLSVSKLPEGSQWLWEIKLDGYRSLAVKSGSDVTLDSVFPKLRFLNETGALLVDDGRTS
jgi:ATP-dependent DNA ligase